MSKEQPVIIFKEQAGENDDFDSSPTIRNSLRVHSLNSSIREKRGNTHDLTNLRRNIKSRIIRNNLKLLLGLNCLPLLGIIFCITQPKWYRFHSDKFFQYWVNPLIYLMVSSGDNVTDYQTGFLYTFKDSGCSGNYQVCDSITSYVFAGLVSSILLLLAVTMHLMNIVQLTLMVRGQAKPLKRCLSTGKTQILVIFLYITVFCYWFFASGLFTVVREFTEFFSNAGLIILLYLICLLVYAMLMIYYRHIFRSGRRVALVNKLLQAEQDLLKEIM